MNHQERMELLAALSRFGVTHYKSHDLEIRLGPIHKPEDLVARLPDTPADSPAPESQNDVATAKLKDLIDTLHLDHASLVDKIFPAGAGG